MTGGDWVVLVPQKDLRRAKSRLELNAWDRQAVARALLRDTVTAAQTTAGVAEVVVVLDCHRDLDAVDDLGVRPVLATGSGLNEALRHGERAARTGRPRCAVAALPADLPFIEPDVLGRALAYAQAHDRAFVADAEGRGTTLLTARSRVPLQPSYGIGSRQAHRRSGAAELAERDLAPLRFDVDLLTHLRLVSPLVHHSNLAAALEGLPLETCGPLSATHRTLPEGQPWIC